MRASWLFIAVFSAAGCGPSVGEALVDVRTDLVPGVEFDAIVTRIGEREVRAGVIDSEDYGAGVRVAEIRDLETGPQVVTVALEFRGAVVVSRRIRFTVATVTGVTAVFTRDCRHVTCGEEEDPDVAACLGGACVDVSCTPENPDTCTSGGCVTDSDCTSASACTVGRCVAGACLFAPDDSACAAGERCVPERGCLALTVPFGPPTEALDFGSDDITLTADMLEMYLDGASIYVSRRVSVDEAWPAPTEVAEISVSPRATDVTISSDGLRLFYSLGGSDTVWNPFVSTRVDRDSPWTDGAPITELTSTDDERIQWVSDDALEMFIEVGDVMRVARRSDVGSPWALEADAGFGSLPRNAGDIWIFDGGLRALVTMHYDESLTKTADDIFEVSRPDLTSDFDFPVLHEALATDREDTSPWLSPDGRTLYYVRGLRGSEAGIYEARR